MLKHLPHSGMDFLLHISIFLRLCIPFLPSGRHILLFPSTRRQSLSTLLLSSSLSISPPVSQSFLNASLHPVYSSFWSFNSILLPARPASALDSLLCISLSPSRMGLTNPGQALIQFSLLLISPKLLTLSGIPSFSINSFWLASL